MSTALRCDACDLIVQPKRVAYMGPRPHATLNVDYERTFELCEACTKNVLKYLETLRAS